MARIERVDYSTYIKPLEHIQKAHNDTLADMANMSSQSEILDYYLDPERDSESYNLYNNFKQEFNTNVDDFAKNGLTRNNGARLLNLHRNYNKNVANVLDAVKNRETERAEQHKLSQQSNGQIVFGKGQNADYKSVDDYLQGNKGFDYQNLDEIHKFAKNAATAASKREYSNNIKDALQVLNNDYYNIMELQGYNNADAHSIINNLFTDMENNLQGDVDDKDTPAGFIRNMRTELDRRGLDNYSEEDKRKMINSYITGTFEGLSYEPKMTLKETEKMKRAGASRQSFNLGPQIEKDETHYITDDNLAKSTFNNGNSKDQVLHYESMLNGQNEVYKSLIVPSVYKDDNGRQLHRIAQIDEWMNNVGYKTDPKSGAVYRGNEITPKNQLKQITIQGENGTKRTVYIPQSAINKYNEVVRGIETMYHFNPGMNGKFGTEIQSAISPMSSDDCIENLIPRQIEINENDAKAHQYLSTVLKIDPSDKDAALKEMLGLLGDEPIMTGAQYDPKNHVWKFNSNGDSSDIKKLLWNGNNKGVTISLVDMPTSKRDPNPLWVQLNIPKEDGDGSYVGFVPLAKYAHSSEAKTSTQFNELAKRRKEIIQRNARVLNLPDNITIDGINKMIAQYKKIKDKDERNTMLDAAAQILESIPLVDLYLHRKNMIASDGTSANRTVKQVIDDLNKAEGNDK